MVNKEIVYLDNTGKIKVSWDKMLQYTTEPTKMCFVLVLYSYRGERGP